MLNFRAAARVAGVLGLGAVSLWAAPTPTSPYGAPTAPTAISYQEGGSDYFAITLRAPARPVAAIARNHVLIFDTSASQAGDYRTQGLAVLDAFLARLPDSDRVQLVAVDVQVKPLTAGLVGPRSAEMQAGRRLLNQRVPLGATNLLPALRHALATLAGPRAATIAYIGDGMSVGQLISPADMTALHADLAAAQVPVNSFAIGPQTNGQVLGMLASHSGGVVLQDSPDIPGQQSGMQLADAAVAPVFYTSGLKTEPAVPHLVPNLPPMRSDRETILIGEGSLPASFSVRMEGAINHQSQPTLTWQVAATESHVGNTFLAGLCRQAKADAGLTYGLTSRDTLEAARQGFEDHVANLTGQGQLALASHQVQLAERRAWQVRQLDPENADARTILVSARQMNQVRAVALAQEAEAVEATPTADTPAAPAPAVDDSDATTPGTTLNTDDLIKLETDRIRIREQKFQSEINRDIEYSRKLVESDPDAAIAAIKTRLVTVEAALDLSAGFRERERARLSRVLGEMQARKIQIDQRNIDRVRARALAEASRKTVSQTLEREEKIERLIDQVRSLIAQGFLGNELAFEEAEAVARAAWELAPYNGATALGIVDSESAGQLDKAQRLRYLRADRFLETLHQVELSHVPFPDEPPVIYPPAEVWQKLTNDRAKWKSVDLTKQDEVEEKIRATLDRPVELNFIDTPFNSTIEFLKEQHGINIVIQTKDLEDEGVAVDSPVTLQLSGIRLRSALKLLLQPLQLTYVIEDQVMKITTIAKSGETLTSRVYSVADLVIPIQMLSGAGGGGFGGQGSSFGGQNGGGGFGGGQQGGGFGGQQGGGGFFSVADDEPRGLNNAAVEGLKKKTRLR